MRLMPTTCLLTALLLAACASSSRPDISATYDPAASTALNIARMAGLDGLSDQRGQALPGPSGGIGVGDIGFAASSAASPPPGFSGGAGVAMGALSLLTAPPRRDAPAMTFHIWAWVPTDIAPTPEAAKAAIGAAIKTAMLRVFDPDGTMGEKDAIFSPTLAPDSHYQVLVKPGCPPFKDAHRTAYDESCSGTVSPVIAPTERLATISPAPPFIKDAAQVRGPVNIVITGTGIFHNRLAGPGAPWAALSTALPPWIFIYMPPGQAGRTAPVVLTSGQPLPFGKPAN